MDYYELGKIGAMTLFGIWAGYSELKRRAEERRHKAELQQVKKNRRSDIHDDMRDHARLYALIYADAIRTCERTGAIRTCVDQFHNGDRFNMGNQFFKLTMTVEATNGEATPSVANRFQAQPWTQYLPQISALFSDPVSPLPGVDIKTIKDRTGSERRFISLCRDKLQSGICRELMHTHGVACWVATLIVDPISKNPMGMVTCHFDDESRIDIHRVSDEAGGPPDGIGCARFCPLNKTKLEPLGWFADSCAIRIREMQSQELRERDEEEYNRRIATATVIRPATGPQLPIGDD